MITMGEKGLLYRRDGKVCLLPAYPVKAVDTNGTEDIFHGAFAYGMSKNMDFYDILKLSSMSAAMTYHTASVCIPPSFVKRAKEYRGDRMAVCTVIGFPNGHQTTQVKEFETIDAIKNGADEIDIVINLGDTKEKKYDTIRNEIVKLKAACGDRILKVIIETCLLTEEEKVKMCQIVTEAGAISSFEDAQKFIELGAAWLGTRRLVKIAKASAR